MTQFWRRRRFVPMTVAATAMLLALKLATLGQALLQGRPSSSAMVSAAQAESAPEPPPAAKAAATPTPTAMPTSTPMPEAAAMVPAVAPSTPEPSISTAERQLLQDLRNRRSELDSREQTLQQRETVLDAAQRRLEGRIAELAALQGRLEQLEAERREHDLANWAGLVKVYETMKPREAAVIFNDMEMPVLLEVMDRMKDSHAALILGAMQPDRARQVTAQLAAQRTRSTTVPPERANAG